MLQRRPEARVLEHKIIRKTLVIACSAGMMEVLALGQRID